MPSDEDYISETHFCVMASRFFTSESAVANQQVKFPTSHGSKMCECGCTESAVISTQIQICVECERWRDISSSMEDYEA